MSLLQQDGSETPLDGNLELHQMQHQIYGEGLYGEVKKNALSLF